MALNDVTKKKGTKRMRKEKSMGNNDEPKNIYDLRREFGVANNGTFKKSLRSLVFGNEEVVFRCRLMEILGISKVYPEGDLKTGEVSVNFADGVLEAFVFLGNMGMMNPVDFQLHLLAEIRVFRENLKENNIAVADGITNVYINFDYDNHEGFISDFSKYKAIQFAEFDDRFWVTLTFEEC